MSKFWNKKTQEITPYVAGEQPKNMNRLIKLNTNENPYGPSPKAAKVLKDFNPDDVDMYNIVLIGNSQSYIFDGKFVTPRGYYREQMTEGKNVGQSIMIKSFQTIKRELKNPDMPLWKLWPLLHAIHTTADFPAELHFYAVSSPPG